MGLYLVNKKGKPQGSWHDEKRISIWIESGYNRVTEEMKNRFFLEIPLRPLDFKRNNSFIFDEAYDILKRALFKGVYGRDLKLR